MGRNEETGFSGRTKKQATFLPVSLFDLNVVSSSRPANATTPVAAAVKAGRRTGGAARSAVARPRLDGGEHGVKLTAAGPAFPLPKRGKE
jgi:hypothetical protein